MSRVLRVVYFFEDIAHERFVRSLTKRVARECGVEIEEDVRNTTHGSKVWSEWRQFLREIRKGWVPQPDVLVVVVDGDCRGAAQVRRQLEEEAVRIEPRLFRLVCAVPDPHIERWYLEDAEALPRVVPGARPRPLRYKCERDRYKNALRNAIRAAGVEPILGGAEYGEAIAEVLRPERMDRSFQRFWEDLRAALCALHAAFG
jgi:hypothetical protein